MLAQQHAGQATHDAVQAAAQAGEHAASEGFNAGEVIIEHFANIPHDHPLIHLPALFGIDMSVTKHVFMLWLIATAVFVLVTFVVRRYLASGRMVPTGVMNAV